MTRSRRTLPHLSSQWEHLAARIRASRRVVVFLDFDGTLVRIAPRPDQVHLAPATRRILRRLAAHPRVTLVVISGRRRAELLCHIAIRKIHYFGLYGWECGSRAALPSSVLKMLRFARRRLMLRLIRLPGVLIENKHNTLSALPAVWVEDKRSSLSIHHLGVALPVQRRVRRELRSFLKPFRGRLRLFENHRDVEIVPHSITGKGDAVRQFLAKRKFRHALPIYFGDDLSDEPAFAAVRRGISIVVGKPRTTRAQFRLRSPTEVAAALVKLEAALA